MEISKRLPPLSSPARGGGPAPSSAPSARGTAAPPARRSDAASDIPAAPATPLQKLSTALERADGESAVRSVDGFLVTLRPLGPEGAAAGFAALVGTVAGLPDALPAKASAISVLLNNAFFADGAPDLQKATLRQLYGEATRLADRVATDAPGPHARGRLIGRFVQGLIAVGDPRLLLEAHARLSTVERHRISDLRGWTSELSALHSAGQREASTQLAAIGVARLEQLVEARLPEGPRRVLTRDLILRLVHEAPSAAHLREVMAKVMTRAQTLDAARELARAVIDELGHLTAAEGAVRGSAARTLRGYLELAQNPGLDIRSHHPDPVAYDRAVGAARGARSAV